MISYFTIIKSTQLKLFSHGRIFAIDIGNKFRAFDPFAYRLLSIVNGSSSQKGQFRSLLDHGAKRPRNSSQDKVNLDIK